MILIVEKETEAQRGLVICYMSQSREVAELELDPSWSKRLRI